MWSLGSPLMLGWLAAAAIPIVLMWWQRPQRKSMRFAAMQFLERAIARQGRSHAWLQWWLVALQVLAIVLLAFAWGNLQWLFDRTTTTERTWHVLLIDATVSMSAVDRSTGRTHFEAAVDSARQVVRSGQPGDFYSLLVVKQQCEVFWREPIERQEIALRELDRLRVSSEAGSFAAALREVSNLAKTSDGKIAADQMVLHACSDFQATWPADGDNNIDIAWRELQVAAQKFQPHWQLHDVGPVPTDQLAQRDLTCDAEWLFAGQAGIVRGEIENPSAVERQVRVTWFVDDALVAEQMETVPAAASHSFVRRLAFATPGEHVVAAVLNDDVLPFAKRREIVVPVRNEIRVLAIGGSAGETRPAAIALAPDSIAPMVKVEEQRDLRMLANDLTDYDVVVLANLRGLTAAESTRLKEFQFGGGGVIVLLGNVSQASDWSQVSWLPADVEEPPPPQFVTFAAGDYRHPLVSIFRDAAGGGLTTVPTWQHFPLRPRPESEVALTFSDGSPAVITSATNGGRVVLWSIPWNSQAEVKLTDGSSAPWTALDQWPCFVPLAQESLRYVVASGAAPQTFHVGDPLAGQWPRRDATSLQISRPDGRTDQLISRAEGNVLSWTYGGADVPGVYEVQSREGNSLRKIAVSVPIEEADRTRRDMPLSDAEEIAAPTRLAQLAQAFPWQRLLLGLAFMALVLESLLNWQLGRKVS